MSLEEYAVEARDHDRRRRIVQTSCDNNTAGSYVSQVKVKNENMSFHETFAFFTLYSM